jgi:hypothetical protein
MIILFIIGNRIFYNSSNNKILSKVSDNNQEKIKDENKGVTITPNSINSKKDQGPQIVDNQINSKIALNINEQSKKQIEITNEENADFIKNYQDIIVSKDLGNGKTLVYNRKPYSPSYPDNVNFGDNGVYVIDNKTGDKTILAQASKENPNFSMIYMKNSAGQYKIVVENKGQNISVFDVAGKKEKELFNSNLKTKDEYINLNTKGEVNGLINASVPTNKDSQSGSSVNENKDFSF